jgi:hypothetical protein
MWFCTRSRKFEPEVSGSAQSAQPKRPMVLSFMRCNRFSFSAGRIAAGTMCVFDACTNLGGALNKIGVLKHTPAPVALKEYSPTKECSSSAGFRRLKGGVSDRYGRSKRPAQNLNLGIELMRKRLDNGGAEPGLCLGKSAVRSANSVVDD